MARGEGVNNLALGARRRSPSSGSPSPSVERLSSNQQRGVGVRSPKEELLERVPNLEYARNQKKRLEDELTRWGEEHRKYATQAQEALDERDKIPVWNIVERKRLEELANDLQSRAATCSREATGCIRGIGNLKVAERYLLEDLEKEQDITIVTRPR